MKRQEPDAPELPAFAATHLMSDQVFVVPDSDWHENSEVIFYAVCAREYLRRIGVDAHLAAPPPRAKADTVGSYKQGVDDFLGPKGSPARRHSPDQLFEKKAFKATGRYPSWMDGGWEWRNGKPVNRPAARAPRPRSGFTPTYA